jgi:predicted metal-dependent hydrolase
LALQVFPRRRRIYSPEMDNYLIREHPRARNVRLRVTADEGLVVVIPPGFDHRMIPGVIEQERSWIEKARLWADRQRLIGERVDRPSLPEHVSLRAIDESWPIEYQRTVSQQTVARESSAGRLRVSGDTGDITSCQKALRRWTARKTRQHLVPWLERLSSKEKLPFGIASVRNQSSRWASCSPLGTISINMKMLFIPRPLVRYVFIHELCHLVRMDHSQHFWSQVASREPSYRQLERELRSAWRYIPAWMGD